MLGIGWTEMLVVGVVALIVIGPKELPALMQRLGRFAGTVRRMGTDFQRELNKTTGLDEVRSLRSSITQPLKATTDAIRKEFNTTTAAGVTKPSGALKPADPAAESVVDEIHAAAGIKPAQTAAEAMKEAVGKGVAASAASKAVASKAAASAKPKDKPKVPVKAARVPRAKPAPTMPVSSADLEPVAATPKPSARSAKPIESPAPVEAIPPKPKRAAAKPAAAKPAPKRKPAARKS